MTRVSTDMDDLIHAHPPRETEPDCIVVWLLFNAHSGARKAAQPSVHHKAKCWDDDDSDSFTVEWRMDVFQDVKALKEHKVDIKSATITQTTTKIVKQVSNWRPAGITWVRLEPGAAVLTPNTAATTRTTRNVLN